MNLQQRKELLVRLGSYMQTADEQWQAGKQKAYAENNWFIPEFIELSVKNIAHNFLRSEQLDQLIARYRIPEHNHYPKKVGIVMAGNIPLVGFHDLLCVFLAGHYARIKPSSKDEVLIKHLVKKLIEWDRQVEQFIVISEMIRNCDAYIATGSNNSSRYFEYYFGKYPSIIRKNRTSVAVLTGKESKEELEKLSDDVYQYFGLGCRNVTKIFVPKNYDFVPLLDAFKKYDRLVDHYKYKNNYDYNLAIHILNNQYYMSNGSILLIENESPFSRIGQLHYEFYSDGKAVREKLKKDQNIQCIVGKDDIDFGGAQCPDVCDYADGVDTMSFLLNLG
jgi:Acyl-CoA reductase (LuxC)